MKTNFAHYIGITGIRILTEAQTCAEIAATKLSLGSTKHALMLGCLVSEGLLKNSRAVNTTRPERHLSSFSELAKILKFAKAKEIIGMLHYELPKESIASVNEAQPVMALLKRLEEQQLAPAIQINGILDKQFVETILNDFSVPIILQLRAETINQGNEAILHYLGNFAGNSLRILIDASAGEGRAFDPKQSVKLSKLIAQRYTGQFSFGYAGGLGGLSKQQAEKTTDSLRTLRSELGTSNFSIDVESGVRKSTGKGEEEIDFTAVSAYYLAVQQALN